MIYTKAQEVIPTAKGSVHVEMSWKFNVIGGNNKKIEIETQNPIKTKYS